MWKLVKAEITYHSWYLFFLIATTIVFGFAGVFAYSLPHSGISNMPPLFFFFWLFGIPSMGIAFQLQDDRYGGKLHFHRTLPINPIEIASARLIATTFWLVPATIIWCLIYGLNIFLSPNPLPAIWLLMPFLPLLFFYTFELKENIRHDHGKTAMVINVFLFIIIIAILGAGIGFDVENEGQALSKIPPLVGLGVLILCGSLGAASIKTYENRRYDEGEFFQRK